MELVVGTSGRPMSSPEPMKVARDLVNHSFSTPNNKGGLWYYNGSYYQWYGNQWHLRDDTWLEDTLWVLLEDAYYTENTVNGPELRRMKPNRGKIENIVRAIGACTKVPHSGVPLWLNGEGSFDATRGIAFQDVVFDAKTGQTVPRDEDWFDPVTLPVGFDPDSTCPRWMQCLEEWSGGDPTWVDLLQRWMGYCLLPHRRFAKWMLMYGKVRAGKGTIARILERLIGRECYMGTSLDDLAGEFGLDGLERSRVICVSEVSELEGKDGERCTRVLKNIVGQDPITVNVKFQRQMRNVVVNAAPMMQANEIPMLPNKGRGLSSKMLLLPFDRTFEGKEDPDLLEKLEKELVGIAAWAAAGAQKVETCRDSGRRFPMPKRAEEAVKLYHIQNNPFDHFLEERFLRSESGFVATDMLWWQWKDWLKANGIRNVHVARNQIAMKIEAGSSWGVYRHRPGANSKRGLRGLSLRKNFEDVS